jgi:hypothetical protein
MTSFVLAVVNDLPGCSISAETEGRRWTVTVRDRDGDHLDLGPLCDKVDTYDLRIADGDVDLAAGEADLIVERPEVDDGE